MKPLIAGKQGPTEPRFTAIAWTIVDSIPTRSTTKELHCTSLYKQLTIARVVRPSSPANENRRTSLCGRRKQCAESSGEHAYDLPTKTSDCGRPKVQTQGLRCPNQEATHQRVVMWALGQVTWSNLTFIAHNDDNPNTHFLRRRGHI